MAILAFSAARALASKLQHAKAMSDTLTGKQLEEATAYNRDRNFDPETIEMIQRVVGAPVDGEMGPETTEMVFVWQGEHGLEQDGKIGPVTFEAIQRAAQDGEQVIHRHGGGKLGVWVDSSPHHVLTSSYLGALREMHFKTLAIMVQRSTAFGHVGPWEPTWTVAQLEQLRGMSLALGFEIVLTAWPLPNAGQLQTFSERLPDLLEAAGAVGLEVDAEGNWNHKHLNGFSTMDQAAARLVEVLRGAANAAGAPAGKPVQVGLTTYPYHPENGAHAKVAPHVDLLLPQAYSTYNPKRAGRSWDGRFGPGAMQTMTHDLARTVPGVAEGEPKLGLGLAAYAQDFPGHSVSEALQKAYDRARSLGAVELRWWSSANLLSTRKASAAAMRTWFRSLDEGSGEIGEVAGVDVDVDEDGAALEALRDGQVESEA